MPQKQGAARSAAEQRAKFEETARALGCDEGAAAFRDKLRVIARQKPKAEPASAKTAKKPK